MRHNCRWPKKKPFNMGEVWIPVCSWNLDAKNWGWGYDWANLHFIKTWISLEQKKIFENSKGPFSSRADYLFMFWNGWDRKGANFISSILWNSPLNYFKSVIAECCVIISYLVHCSEVHFTTVHRLWHSCCYGRYGCYYLAAYFETLILCMAD